MECLLRLYEREKVKNPIVMLTDRELALMNAIKEVFPSVENLLCIWHINKNVLAHCKMAFTTKEDWDAFNTAWRAVIYADSVQTFETRWRELSDYYGDEDIYPGVVAYLQETWLNDKVAPRFLVHHTNQIMHFGNTATSRVESAHRRLKQGLQTSVGDLKTVVDEIDVILSGQRSDFTGKLQLAKIRIPIEFHKPFLAEIRSQITHKALNKILAQFHKLSESQKPGGVLPPCTGAFRRTHGLPCAHEIETALQSPERRLRLDQIHAYWRYKQPTDHSTREQREPVEEEDADPILSVQEPAIAGRQRGRPPGSTVLVVASQRAAAAAEASTQRAMSQFEHVEEAFDLRASQQTQSSQRGRGTGRARGRPRGSRGTTRGRGSGDIADIDGVPSSMTSIIEL